MKKTSALYLFDESARFRKKAFSFLKKIRPKELIISSSMIDEGFKKSIVEHMRLIDPELKIEVFDFLNVFNKKAFSIKNTYVKFISDFGNFKISPRKNVKEYFKFPFKNFSTWWFSLIAEKNTLKSNSYYKLVKFLTVLDIQDRFGCERILLDISDDVLVSMLIKQYRFSKIKIFNLNHHKLRNNLTVFFPFLVIIRTFFIIAQKLLRTIFTKIVMENFKERKRRLQESDFLLVTYFPIIDNEKMAKGEFVDKYYNPLQNALQKHGKKFSWVAIIGDIAGFSFEESVNIGRHANKQGHCFFFCKEWIRPRDIFIIILGYLYIVSKFLLKKTHLARNFKYPGLNTDVWPIFERDWLNSFVGRNLIDSLFFYRIFKNLFHTLKQDSTILYIAEMHAWEKALNIASQETGRLRTVGVQHTIVPVLLLNYFNDRNELRSSDNIQSMPTPRHLGCTGKIPAKIFEDMGWPREKIFQLGAIRFRHLNTSSERRISWKDRGNTAVLALPLSNSESRELIAYIYYAFKDQRKCEILIKSHPARDANKIINLLKRDLDEAIFHITEKPLSDILPFAKIAIVTESSAALEAIAYECPVVIPKLNYSIDMNPLTGISDLGIHVCGIDELKNTVIQIVESDNNPFACERYEKFLNEYLDLPSSDDDFLLRLENLR